MDLNIDVIVPVRHKQISGREINPRGFPDKFHVLSAPARRNCVALMFGDTVITVISDELVSAVKRATLAQQSIAS